MGSAAAGRVAARVLGPASPAGPSGNVSHVAAFRHGPCGSGRGHCGREVLAQRISFIVGAVGYGFIRRWVSPNARQGLRPQAVILPRRIGGHCDPRP